jgi:stearoyl-CoA desaturase (Delta-9 desaturase)
MSIVEVPPFPQLEPEARDGSGGRPLYHRIASAIVMVAPLLVGAYVVWRGVTGTFQRMPIVLVGVFMIVVGHGVTVGFHRLFAHRSFEAKRPLRVALAFVGSLSFQGSLIGWVADHRRHHRVADRLGDPHSPIWSNDGESLTGLRGLWHAHAGWCFTNAFTSREQYAPDLLADPDLVAIDRLFVPMCVATLAIPFGLGYLIAGTAAGAVTAALWAGVVRVGITHNLTWSVNSVCHRFGKRSFATNDLSTNVGWLAALTMGESWHNNHHAFPRSARHGLDHGQLDTSAMLIRLMERLGWATKVNWPSPALVEARRAS